MSIGERLRKLRSSTKKTLKEASEIFGISLNTVYRWEHDLCIPRKTVLMKMAEAYGVHFEWILSGVEDGENAVGESRIFGPATDIEQRILKMIRRLPEAKKYSIIGYIERMIVEEEEKKAKESQNLLV